jgi:prepilin signal peptidase PulO-like enzyme (type II secretory pathway)
MKLLILLAQDAVMPTNVTQMIWIVISSGLAGVTAVYGWFRGELNECKKDRKELFARVEALHGEVSALSLRVGQFERPKD